MQNLSCLYCIKIINFSVFCGDTYFAFVNAGYLALKSLSRNRFTSS